MCFSALASFNVCSFHFLDGSTRSLGSWTLTTVARTYSVACSFKNRKVLCRVCDDHVCSISLTLSLSHTHSLFLCVCVCHRINANDLRKFLTKINNRTFQARFRQVFQVLYTYNTTLRSGILLPNTISSVVPLPVFVCCCCNVREIRSVHPFIFLFP